MHAVQLAAELQTMLVPQFVPAASVGFEHTPPLQVPAAWQTSLAVQDIGVPAQVPFVHWSPVVQALPSSQVVPFAADCVGMQVECPLAQEVVPSAQTLPPGLQAALAVQETHCPPLQT